MSTSASNLTVILSPSLISNDHQQSTTDPTLDWRNNPYIVNLFRVLLIVCFVFLIRLVMQYVKLPGACTCSSIYPKDSASCC